MKKLICGFLCVTVGVALADVVESVVATIEVRAITSSLTNTVVAIPGFDLATGGELAISNLVKTTNLEAGDKLVAFDGERYETWTLSAVGGKHWEKTAKKITILADGSESDAAGIDASLYTLSVGKGIWLSRTVSGTASPFYVYAQQPESTSTTVRAGATALVGNPTTDDKSPTITDPAINDIIVLPQQSGTSKRYQYTGSKWFFGGTKYDVPPSITAGTGFWYISKGESNVTITW